MAMVTSATIRAAGINDVERILAKYRQAIRELSRDESANLLWRPYDEFKAAVENGLFFVVEDEAGEFMAGAGVFDLAESRDKELGMCYVKQPWRGYGLQTLLLQIRVCAATLGQVPADADRGANISYAALITGVKPSNGPSCANTAGFGFEPLDTPLPALFAACGSCRTPPSAGSGRRCCCDFFYLSDRKRVEAIERSLLMGQWSRTRGDHQLIVSPKVRHLTDPDFRGALQDIMQELRVRMKDPCRATCLN